MESNTIGKTLVGYGGRRFRLKFEPTIEVKYPDGPDDAAAQNAPTQHADVLLVNWQVQEHESMKYELVLSFESDGQKWKLTGASNRYLGLKDKNGFKPTRGFKKLDVLKKMKGNVYMQPIAQATSNVLGK